MYALYLKYATNVMITNYVCYSPPSAIYKVGGGGLHGHAFAGENLVDAKEFVGGEGKVVERLEVVVQLRHGRGADDDARHARVVEQPG